MQKIYITIWSSFFLIFKTTAISQIPSDLLSLPVNVMNAGTDTTRPFIIYITGDGGWNKFSKSLAAEFVAKGYPVAALNAAKYFWDKKTPAQSAADVEKMIIDYQRIWKRKKFLLIGYSFGADVMPFIYNNLDRAIALHAVNISLLSPSKKTDFEIHVLGMFGADGGDESVPKAINKINSKPITLIFGEDENSFPVAQLTIKNYTLIKLAGGHHYDGNEADVCNSILNQVGK